MSKPIEEGQNPLIAFVKALARRQARIDADEEFRGGKAMTEWQTTEPPLDREIEYERDNRSIETGILKTAGSFGTDPGARAPKMRLQYHREGVGEMFEIMRWREIE